jgi:hypothetical protein
MNAAELFRDVVAARRGRTAGRRRYLCASGRMMMLMVAAVLTAAACTSPPPGVGQAPPAAQAAYGAGLWAERPVVELTFDLAPDLSSVAGRERVVFTPDLSVCELVFRAWPNKPNMADGGTAMIVTDAAVDGRPILPRVLPAGAPPGSPGTLVELPLPQCVPADQPITAELGFTLALGEDVDDRVGFSRDPQMAWFGAGFPLLAWVRGEGWAREDAVSIAGETATSEDFTLSSLTVNAPAGNAVLGTGTATETRPGPVPGTTSHRFGAEAVRNVAVSVGRFDIIEREVGGVRVHLGIPISGTQVSPQAWLDRLEQDMRTLSDLLGPFPYLDLWVSVIPSQSSGLEFPSALQFGDLGPDDLPRLVSHELAHQWFYALVGNNQARDPWIDESFATFAQALATNQEQGYVLADIPDDRLGEMGRPMSYWGDYFGFDRYVQVVYNQGGAVLLEARRRAGEEHFDDALRGYITANAHRVAAAEDVARGFLELPEVRGVLTEYGALPPGP